MAQPRFITTRSALETAAPFYIGHVQHERSLNRAQSLAFLRGKLGYPSAQISSALNALAKVMRECAKRAQTSTVDGIARVGIEVKGAFDGSDGPWKKSRNMLVLTLVELDPFKSGLSGIVPRNATSGANPRITTLLDDVTQVYDVITGTDTFTIAGVDLGVDVDAPDEYVGLLDKDGNLTRAEIVSSSVETIVARLGSALTAGAYTLVVATRSGYGEAFGVKTATRKIQVA